MQAYQSPPCPYCGVTWNQPGAQSCANCRNPLPPPGYAPPGYQNYPPQNYPQPPPQYPGPPPGYPGQPGQPGQPGYPPYGPPGYAPPGYPQQPGGYGPDPGYASYAPGPPPPGPGTTFQVFGQTFTLPVALPPALLQFPLPSVRAAAGVVVGLVVVLVLFFGVIPAVATGQISAATQSLKTAASHQDKIDTAFAQAFTLRNNTDPVAADKVAKSFGEGLSLVQSDVQAVASVDKWLTFLKWVAPSKGAGIAAARNRLNGAAVGLKQADQALTAAVNEVKVLQPYADAFNDSTKMISALNKRDLVGAAAPYPDAQQKIELAMSYSHAAGVPPQMAKQVSSLNDVLANTESLLQAIQAKDAAGIKKYTDAMNAALKAMSTPEEMVPADYEAKTFGPMQKAYDAAMKAIKSGS